ncbi:hypothetical protein CABS01_05351 [Colletotrichum abscissum]|uniref:uncharacterized protein n=1 Tax=Colletotrichum abscissum TaxID=1671311 RepID=UPI0027D5C587|nr:uncharacterized protein CABS01_05351 [Colletotrichum abscissum]KAK1523730.1 hypothetical protein CABS01_05351 [Colletotrichum abscissum]
MSYAIRIPRFSPFSSLFPMGLLRESHFIVVADPVTRAVVDKYRYITGEEGPWGPAMINLDRLRRAVHTTLFHCWKSNHFAPTTFKTCPALGHAEVCSLICISSAISFCPRRKIPLSAPICHDPAARPPSFEEMILIHWLEPFLVANLVSHSFSKQRDPREDLLSPGSR